MSVNFYVALPAATWPTAVAIEKCLADSSYPLRIKRFPVLNGNRVVREGILTSIDGEDAYLQGQIAIASSIAEDVNSINGRLIAAGSPERIKSTDVVASFNVASPAEMRATSYVVSALIVCFKGFGYEPQGYTSGRNDFAQSLYQVPKLCRVVKASSLNRPLTICMRAIGR
ncbi:hypothetical protein [Sphingomonas sp. BK580]|uniref:hypothetical protein n=1 Tax=Sphingomonas sp. BK580 TaxID=2586972 RepID=UPI00162275F2|nr:hypothetical protein [Sphingomonas sp. BK580]MBB3692061.1 hypothetical protein [Sphingomonas sp. BK580]